MAGLIKHTENPIKTIYKTADEIVNNSNVLQDDDELTYPIAASEKVLVIISLINSSATTTPLMKLGLSLPAGAVFYGQEICHNLSNTDVTYTCTNAIYGIYAMNSTRCHGVLILTVINSSTAGNMVLQWAQNTATAEDTKLKAGSSMIVVKIP